MSVQTITLNLLRAAAQSQTPSDFCSKIVYSVLGNSGCVGATLFALGKDANLRVLGSFGYSGLANGVTSVQLFSRHQIADAVLNGEVDYSQPSDTHGDQVCSISVRITNDGLPAGGMQLFFSAPTSEETIALCTIEAIAVAAEPFVSNNLRGQFLAASKVRAHFGASGGEFAGQELSPRQTELLHQMAKGLTYAAIAAGMHLSESSIKQEASRIFRKLGVANRYEAAAVCARNQETVKDSQ